MSSGDEDTQDYRIEAQVLAWIHKQSDAEPGWIERVKQRPSFQRRVAAAVEAVKQHRRRKRELRHALIAGQEGFKEYEEAQQVVGPLASSNSTLSASAAEAAYMTHHRVCEQETSGLWLRSRTVPRQQGGAENQQDGADCSVRRNLLADSSSSAEGTGEYSTPRALLSREQIDGIISNTNERLAAAREYSETARQTLTDLVQISAA
ncbi:hypothetical protein Emed_007347 [Eimeria media]